MSLNDLFDTNEDSDDDNDDEDFKPENVVLSENSDSGSEGEDESSGRRKHKSNGKQAEDVEEVKEQLTEEELKQKSDSLWEEFQKDIPKTNKTNDSSVADNGSNQSSGTTEKILITKTYDFAGEEVKVTEEVANTSKAKSISDDKESDDSKAPPKAVKRSGGLGSVLSQLKKPKISVLQKSLVDWKNFKQTKGLEEELDQHTRSKDTFVERQAFLQRTDLRQFEIEKQIREKNRSQRQLSKD